MTSGGGGGPHFFGCFSGARIKRVSVFFSDTFIIISIYLGGFSLAVTSGHCTLIVLCTHRVGLKTFYSTDPMAYGGFINGRRRGTREESRK